MQRCCSTGHEAEQKDCQSDKKFCYLYKFRQLRLYSWELFSFFLLVLLPSFHFAFFLLV